MLRIVRPPSPQPPGSARAPVTKRNWRRRGPAALVILASVTLALVGATAPATAHDHNRGDDDGNAFKQVNLISDLTTFGPDVLVDPAVKNPWGIDFGPTTPLWVANQFTNKVTVYGGANAATRTVTKFPIEVDAHGTTGMLFNPTKKFKITEHGVTAPANFLWNENLNLFDGDPTLPPTGQISGWSNVTAPPPPRNSRVIKVSKVGSGYVGLALVPGNKGKHRHGPLLLAANGFGSIDAYNGKFHTVNLGARAFVDPKAAADGVTPYNVAYLNGRVYVAYFSLEGHGSALSVFKPNGRFVKRLVSSPNNELLASPWGMAIAPRHWGEFGGALLVGNVDDGKINAFNRHSGRWLGALSDAKGQPLVNPGLWGLKFGNGTFGTPNDLVFAAGIGTEVDGQFGEVYEHGLIGIITPAADDDDHNEGS